MSLYWSDDQVTLHLGDCLEVLAGMEAGSVDAIVTDPPAGIAFMDREWDDFRRARNLADAGRDNVFGRTSAHGPEYGRRDRGQFVDWLTERLEQAYRVLKPGGHALVWSIPRTSHWTAWAIEDAGFDIRDCVLHLFGSGFPKSRNVSKDIDAMAEHGTGALNIAGCRITATPEDVAVQKARTGGVMGVSDGRTIYGPGNRLPAGNDAGRWPPNLVLTHSAACEPAGTREVRSDGHHPAARGTGGLGTSGHAGQEGLPERRSGTEVIEVYRCAPDCPVGELDRQSGVLTSGANPLRRGSDKFRDAYGEFAGQPECVAHRGTDSGGASRFYPVFRYQAKAPAAERPRGEDGSAHPTVKSLSLMRYFTRLITPPGGTILDLFAGSGPVAEAAIVEGFKCILIEKDPASAELIRVRLRKDIQPVMFGEIA